jgi:3-phenylpropionate/cinnamic acid dioxygenase small subunit
VNSIDNVQAIKNVLYTYAEFLDAGDLHALGELFERATYAKRRETTRGYAKGVDGVNKSER